MLHRRVIWSAGSLLRQENPLNDLSLRDNWNQHERNLIDTKSWYFVSSSLCCKIKTIHIKKNKKKNKTNESSWGKICRVIQIFYLSVSILFNLTSSYLDFYDKYMTFMNVSRFCRQASRRQNHSHKYVWTVALINADHCNMHEALVHLSGKVHLCCMKAFRHTLKLAVTPRLSFHLFIITHQRVKGHSMLLHTVCCLNVMSL